MEVGGGLSGGAAPEVVVVVRGLAAAAQPARGDVGEDHAEDLAKGRRVGGLELVVPTERQVVPVHLPLRQRVAGRHVVRIHQPCG